MPPESLVQQFWTQLASSGLACLILFAGIVYLVKREKEKREEDIKNEEKRDNERKEYLQQLSAEREEHFETIRLQMEYFRQKQEECEKDRFLMRGQMNDLQKMVKV